MARANLIAFIDDDVVIENSNWLDKMASHFERNSNLGYVSGNVRAFETLTYSQKIWEAKGGLSKGAKSTYWTNDALQSNYSNKVWPLFNIIAGANSMIPKHVFLKVGLFNILFDPGAPIPHGGSLEMGYRIIKSGYDLMYDSESIVLHQHPRDSWQLRKKLFIYGIGATSLHLYLFSKYKDLRSLVYALAGHILGILRNFPASLLGTYPLPVSYLLFSLLGSVFGFFLFGVNFCKIHQYKVVNTFYSLAEKSDKFTE
ncbi:MAG: hypothetical protein GVY04_14410 [Cyanobacteria bacterium]|nr:hypothetical protein [Cyanobacteria bacterium GSL.Bin1]